MAGGQVVANDIYSLAAGFYPLMPRQSIGTAGSSVYHRYNYSSDYRQNTNIANLPNMWYDESGFGSKPFTMGNFIYDSALTGDMNSAGSDTVGTLPSPYEGDMVSQFRSRTGSRAASLVTAAGNMMGVSVQANYVPQQYNLDPTRPIPPSLEETPSGNQRYTPGGGLGIGTSQQYDFIDNQTGRGVNVTKTGLGVDTSGSHGMYGNLQRALLTTVEDIDEAVDARQMTEEEGWYLKAEEGRRYFETRLGDWNNYIRLAKASVGLDPNTDGGTVNQWRDTRAAIRALPTGNDNSDLMQASRSGVNALNVNTGFMTDGGKKMMKQLFSSPDIAFGAGAEERFPVGQRVFAAVYPFQLNPNTFLYRRNILQAEVLFGRMSTMPERNASTLGVRHTNEAISKMVSFSNAIHHSGATTAAINGGNSVEFATHTTGALRIMPELDVQTVSSAWRDAIQRLLGGVGAAADQAAITTPMQNLLSGFTSSWTFFQGNRARDVWAAPYIGILSESEMVSGVSH